MKRKIYDKLLEWKKTSNGRSAVLIDGARRIGKSWIAEEFARNEYESYLLIDFSKVSKEVKGFFENYLEKPDVFFMYLLGAYNARLTPRKSVIIFDEVQKFPRAREAIKHLVADGRFDYIETGSLISIRKNVEKILIPSEEYHLEMFPMDFEEFLWATGNGGFMPIIRDCFSGMRPVGAGMHRRILDVFRQYEIVGGMPQAVNEFVRSHDLAKVDFEKRTIIDLYRADILKYGGRSKHKILGAFNAIPGALSRHEWQFSPGAVRQGAGMREFDAAFEWLKGSMMVNVAYNVTDPNVGLELTSDHHSLKCFLGDTGLLVSMAFGENELTRGEVQQRLLTGRLSVNAGMIYENLVAQTLRAAGHHLYFHAEYDAESGKPTMEVDFLVAKSNLQRRHNVVPIEVKSSNDYATKSLDRFMSKFADYSASACVLHDKDLERVAERTCLPVYMAGLVGQHSWRKLHRPALPDTHDIPLDY